MSYRFLSATTIRYLKVITLLPLFIMDEKFENYWLVFISLAIAVIIVDIDATAANLAIDSLIKELGFSISKGQWIIDGYTMIAASFMALAGKLSDHIGAKKVLSFAFVGIFLSSLITGLANSFSTLLLGRLFQGLCLAFTFPVTATLLRKVFPENKHGLAISLLLSIAGLSQGIGPTFGGIMIEFFSWRLIFLINLPLALIGLYVLVKKCTIKEQTNTSKLNYSSVLPLTVGLFSVMTALNEVNSLGLLSLYFWGLIILGTMSLSYFIYLEFNHHNPLLELSVLLNKKFNSLVVIRLIVNFTYFGLLFGGSILLTHGLNYSALHAGYILLSLTSFIVILAIPVGKFIDKKGTYYPILMGCILLAISCFLFGLKVITRELYFIVLSFSIAGIATACLIPASTTAVMTSISKEKTGAAMGVLSTMGFLGTSLGVAIIGSLMEHFSTSHGFNYAMRLCSLLAIVAFILTIYSKQKSSKNNAMVGQ